ncbi:MAG: serine hydrolase domain-containing protein [Gammaproteobacteria bacterium]
MTTSRLLCALFCLLLCVPLPAAAREDSLADQLTRQIETNRQRYGIAGQAVLVAHNDQVLFRGVDGYADLDTRQPVTLDSIFPLFSLSKLFTSTLVMQLVEQGSIDLDQPVRTYLPDLPERWKAITVRQFLNHTSGVPEYFVEAQMTGTAEANASFAPDLRALFASLADKPLVFPTGSDTRYTQTNYVVLAHLLETHYRKPYPQVASERIIRRLHLTHTFLGDAALPKRGVATDYLSKDRTLQKEPEIAWPDYALGHAGLYASLGDLATFLQAVGNGDLVGKATLQQLWQPQVLSNGRRGWFATGWEIGESGGYRHVGHDGGARVRVRLLFADTLDGDRYTILYLTNGSARSVWSRTLVDSVMATVAPQRFRAEALSEKLIGFALQAPDDRAIQVFSETLRADSGIEKDTLESTVNTAGYAIRSNLGADTALVVFKLNTLLFPNSANTWDSLAETYAALDDKATAKTLYEKAQQLLRATTKTGQ